MLFAAPLAATVLADFGADVIKVEHPSGDPLRRFGWQAGDESLWWKVVARNKRSIALDLATTQGQNTFAALAATADVAIESFRPGTLERWNLDYERLSAENAGLILLRTSGFGQTGPYRDRPGFGTLAEAMSGLAAVTGEADGPPTLPPIALADSIAALAGATMILTALHHRERTGLGQVIDLSLLEPMLWVLGPQAALYEELGVVPQRDGSRMSFTAPRNVYRTADGKWIAMSGSSPNTALRVLRLVGGEELASDPRFSTNSARLANIEDLDQRIAAWVGARTRDEALATLDRAEAATAAVYDVADIVDDPHLRAREALVRHGVLMNGLLAKLSRTPGSLRRTAPELGEHREEILREAGLDPDESAPDRPFG